MTAPASPAGSSSAWLDALRGRFVVFDGPDGSGKTTQFRRFSAHVQAAGLDVCEVREPGGTEVGEQIRTVLLDPHNKEDLDVRCEMLLFMASRAQLISQRIGPAIAGGQLVLADRFISSTLAYQGAAGGLPTEEILAVGRIAVGKHWPNLVVIFDVDEKTTTQRLAGSPKGARYAPPAGESLFADRIERKGAAFHRTVREGYLAQAKGDPEHYLVIDARSDADTVFATLLRELEKRLAASTSKQPSKPTSK
ncbi:MAG: dTMP kinase [Planctomycetota bacterium]|nr:dTMP kinase [Planctomycetota bacterium]